MDPLAATILTAGSGLLLAVLSWFVARRSGLLPLQTSLVDTLQDTVAALERQIAMTQAERDKAASLATVTAAKADELSAAVVDLARENAALRRKYGEPPRHRTAVEREVEP